MIFGAVPVAQALGAVLAHSVPVAGGRLRKGRILVAADLAALTGAGHRQVTVARLGSGDLDEDAAAQAVARALVPDPAASGLTVQAVGTGRVNILAADPGLARIDAARVHAVNAVDPAITLATVAEWHRMDPGGMLATVKIIPYGVDKTSVFMACQAGRAALSLARPVLRHATLIETIVADEKPDGPVPATDSKGYRITAERLARLGVDLAAAECVTHDEAALSRVLVDVAARNAVDLILILTASATSDSQDTAPAALRRAGGAVAHFGMPVDPGNLLFIGDLRGVPVIGLPGCAKSPALNGADWVMERVICGLTVTRAEIQSMGVGGLLKEIPTRPRPRQPIG